MSIIKFDKVDFQYNNESDNPTPAVSDVSFEIEEGEFVAVVGRNGSGKSTIAKLMNGLLTPSSGKVTACGIDTSDESKLFELRSQVGVVFQNPDNQMVAALIEDDLAFGPENLGLPSEEIEKRITWALDSVGMTEYRKCTPYRLSGGQKQRIAIAGVLTIMPKVIVLDESTSMLDPMGRKSVLEIIQKLNQKRNMTVILITHYMEEAINADKILVMNNGKLTYLGGKELFKMEDFVYDMGLDLPPASLIAESLRKKGIALSQDIMSTDELLEAICQYK